MGSSINFSIGVDDTPARRKLEGLQQKMQSVEREAQKAGKSVQQSAQQVAQSAEQAVQAEQRVGEAAEQAGNKASASAEKASGAIGKQGATAQKTGKQVQQLGNTARTAGQAAVQSAEKASGAFGKLGHAVDGALTNIKTALTSMIAGAAGFSAVMKAGDMLTQAYANIGEFNKAMKEVSTISDAVTNDMQGYKDALLDMTTRIPIGATESAKALYQIISAGQEGADAMKVLEISAKAAIGGVTDTATAADTITTLLNAYHLSAEEAQHVSDMLFTTVKRGKTTMAELGASIAQAAPSAAAYGVSMEDLLAAVATLTKQGVPTAVAMTEINAVITQAVEVLGDGAFQGRSFSEALSLIADRSKGSMSAMKDDVKNIRAMKAVLSLTGSAAKDAAADLQAMKDAAGASEEAFSKMFDTRSAERLANNFQKALQPAGDVLKKFGKDTMNFVSEAFETGKIKDYIAVIEGLVAAYGFYRVALVATTTLHSLQVMGIGALTTAEAIHYGWLVMVEKVQKALNLAMLANPATWLALAIGALAGSIVYLATRTDSATLAQQSLNKELDESNKKYAETKSAIEQLVSTGLTHFEQTLQQKDAIGELARKHSELILAYLNKEEHLQKQINLVRELNRLEGIDRENKAKADADKYNELYQRYVKHRNATIGERKRDKTLLYVELANAIYAEETGRNAAFVTNAEAEEYFKVKAQGKSKQAKRIKTENMVDQTIYGINDYTTQQKTSLRNAMQYVISNSNGGKSAVWVNQLQDYITKDDASRILAAMASNGTTDTTATTTATHNSTKSTNKNSADKTAEINEAETKMLELRKRESELATMQANINVLTDGYVKDFATAKYEQYKALLDIDNEEEKMLQDNETIAKQRFENLHRNDKNKPMWVGSAERKSFLANNKLTADEQARFDAERNAVTAKYNETIADIIKAQEQRANELQDKITEAGVDSALAWSEAFDKFGTGLESEVQDAKKQLTAIVNKDAFKKLSADKQTKVLTTLSQLNGTGIKQAWRIAGTALDEYNVAQQNEQKKREAVSDAQKVLKQASDALMNATAGELATAQQNYNNAEKQLELATKEYDTAKQESATAKTKVIAIGNIATSKTDKLLNGINGIIQGRSLSGYWQGANQLSNAISGSDLIKNKKVGGWVGAAFSIADMLNQSGGLAGLLNNITQTIGGALSGVIGSLFDGSMFKSLGTTLVTALTLGLGGSNIKDMEKEIERLTASNKTLEGALNDLKVAIEKSGVGDIKNNYEKAESYLQQQIANAQQIMIDESRKWSMGSHSIQAQVNDSAQFRALMQQVNAILGTNVRSSADFLSLSAEQMRSLRMTDPNLFNAILQLYRDSENTFTGKGIDEMIQNYISDYADAFDELADMVNERLANISFDDVKNSFNDMLKSMTTTSQDWADNFEDLLRSAVINALSDNYNDALKTWYKNFADAFSDGSISAQERDSLFSQYDSIRKNAEEQRDALFSMLNIKDSSGTASATINAAMGITEDTANDLVGRLTAIQLSAERATAQLAESTLQTTATLLSLTTATGEQSVILDDMRNLAVIRNSLLTDIADWCKRNFVMLDEKMTRLVTNTNRL